MPDSPPRTCTADLATPPPLRAPSLHVRVFGTDTCMRPSGGAHSLLRGENASKQAARGHSWFDLLGRVSFMKRCSRATDSFSSPRTSLDSLYDAFSGCNLCETRYGRLREKRSMCSPRKQNREQQGVSRRQTHRPEAAKLPTFSDLSPGPRSIEKACSPDNYPTSVLRL